MRVVSALVALATAHLASAQFSGFNYGSTFTTGAAKQQSDFESEFRAAAGLSGAPVGFNSARLYTMVQAGTSNDPISAIPAAIATKTSLLLGMWASAGDAAFANELTALKRAIQQYGSQLSGLVAGISVGSEDLYRNSPTGKLNNENPGADPSTIVNYISQVRQALAGTALSGVSVGHVDTWTEWVNLDRNKAVVNAVDWLGVDAYPYFETTAAQGNSIDQNKALFDSAFTATQAAGGGKPVWITETGFPVSGKTSGQAVPSVDNARTYWEQVACSYVGRVNVWWYTAQDAAPSTPNPSFGILDSQGKQLYDLSCKTVATTSAAAAAPTSASATTQQPPASSGSTGGSTGGGGGGSGSSPASSAASPATTALIGGGSPGAGGAVPSSQISIQTQSVTGTGSAASSASIPTGTSTLTTSVVGGGANATVSGGSPPATTTAVPTGAAAGRAGSVGAAFAAVLAAALIL